MGTIGPRSTVPAPRPVVWRPGLISAARAAQTYIESPVSQDADNPVEVAVGSELARWANGIAYRPELSFARPDPAGEPGDLVDGPGSYISCPVDDNEVNELDQADKALIPGHPKVEWDPYALYDPDTCTTLSSDIEDSEGRAMRDLERQTSHLIENILWTGEVNGLDFTANHPNTALASADATLPNGVNTVGVVTGLAMMVEALAETIGGTQGMIHVPASLIPFLNNYSQLVRVSPGTNYLMAGDHLVVTGTGYPGTGPSGQDGTIASGIVWIYGTSFVEVRVSGIFNPSVVGNGYAAVDRDTNDLAVIAERLALASWDRTAHIGIPVCIPDPGDDCATSS